MRLVLTAVLLASTTAAAAEPLPEPTWVASITATSTFADKRDAYNPKLLLDPKTTVNQETGATRIDSAWCEGKKDEGVGESVTIKLAKPHAFKKVSIFPGVQMTQALFEANNLITGLSVTTDDGRTFAVAPPAKREAVDVAIGGAPISSLTVAITSVKKGKMNDSCLSEIDLDDDTMAPVVSGVDAAAAGTFATEATAIFQTIFDPPKGTTACDAKKVAQFTTFPFAYVDVENTHSSDEDKRFISHRMTIKSAAAFEKACGGEAFLLAGNHVDSMQEEGAGKVGITVMRAEANSTMVLGAKNGHWRLLTIH